MYKKKTNICNERRTFMKVSDISTVTMAVFVSDRVVQVVRNDSLLFLTALAHTYPVFTSANNNRRLRTTIVDVWGVELILIFYGCDKCTEVSDRHWKGDWLGP
jgi:hypothetical protein